MISRVCLPPWIADARRAVLTLSLLAVVGGPAMAAATALSPYAGEESRAITSLSDADIAELRRGGGWGLAKPAELNGMPGPAHLLELRDQIPLSAAQVEALEALHARMRAQAIAEGERLIALEAALDEAFRARSLDDGALRGMLAAIEASRAALRFIHLSTHLATPGLLSGAQIARYNSLRGYAGDPCAAVPEGHDPQMWRRHRGCDP